MNSPASAAHLFRDVFSASPVGIAVETLEGEPLFVNPALCSFLGFSEEELRRKHWVEFSPPEDADKERVLFEQLRAGSIDHYQLEKRYFRKDGSVVWGHQTVFLVDSHPFRRAFVVVNGIPGRKAVEETRFRDTAIVEPSNDAIVSQDLNAIIVSWNAGAERIFGFTKEEAVGHPITILLPPGSHDEERRICERLRMEGRIAHYETVCVTKSKEKIDVSVSISPIKDASGKLVGFTNIAHDITARKKVEQDLRHNYQVLREQTAMLRAREELLHIFVQNVPAGVAMLDPEMRYLQVSDRFCADLGIERSGVLGRSHYELFPDMPKHWTEVHDRALQGETLRGEDRSEHGGRTAWIRWEVRPWHTADGLPGGILLFAEDITYRKEIEDALSSVSRKLIESQEQDRARLGSELHDDITQRLAILAVELHQLQDNPSDMQGRIRKLWKKMVEVTNDIQSLSHELHSSKLEILGAVRSMRSWCREFGARQGIRIDFNNDVSSALPVDIGLCLLRVLQEALHNAVKHSGVKRVEVQLREKPGEVLLAVNDSGKGFDPERAIKGRGLGLTSMQERVRLAKGTITIHSKPKFGTNIQVRVPLPAEHNSEPLAG